MTQQEFEICNIKYIRNGRDFYSSAHWIAESETHEKLIAKIDVPELKQEYKDWVRVKQNAHQQLLRQLIAEGWEPFGVDWDGKIVKLRKNKAPVAHEQQWQMISCPTTKRLNAISMVSKTHGWAVGDGMTVLFWDGYSWQEIDHSTFLGKGPIKTSQWVDFLAISMISERDGWMVGQAAGNNSVLLRWDGREWREMTSQKGVLRSICMVSSQDGWAVGTLYENSKDILLLLCWDGKEWRNFAHTMPDPFQCPDPIRFLCCRKMKGG